MQFPGGKYLALLALCLGACTSEVSTPSLSSEEIDKEISYQETLAEKWILKNEASVQEKLKSGNRPTSPNPRDQLDHIGRVADAWYRITTANAPLCANHTQPEIGLWLAWLTTQNQHEPWAKKLHLSRTQPTVLAVANGSPAQKLGLKPGDRIVAINHRPVRKTHFIGDLPPEDPVHLSIIRSEKYATLTVVPERACDYGIKVSQKNIFNAYANGHSVVIYGRMIDFFKDDNELAMILSHEMAHNVMRHMRKGVINSTIGYRLGELVQISLGLQDMPGGEFFTKFGAYLGERFNSQGFEAEADYVGLYMAARAQYEITDVADLWRRMAVMAPDGIDSEWSSHPNHAKRYLSLSKTRDEIQTKIAKGEPILPELWADSAPKPQEISPKLGWEVFD